MPLLWNPIQYQLWWKLYWKRWKTNYYCCTSVAKSDWSVAQSCQAISANVKENRIMERCFSLRWLYGKSFSSLCGQSPLIFSHLPRSPSPSPITPAKQANHFQNVSALSQGHTATLHTIPYITCMQSCIQICIHTQPTHSWGIEPRPYWWEASALTTQCQPCSPS